MLGTVLLSSAYAAGWMLGSTASSFAPFGPSLTAALALQALTSLSPRFAQAAAILILPIAANFYFGATQPPAPIATKFFIYPAVAGIVTTMLNMFAPSMPTFATPVAAVVICAHTVAAVSFVAGTLIFPAPVVSQFMIGSANRNRLRDLLLERQGKNLNIVRVDVPAAFGSGTLGTLDVAVLLRPLGRNLASGEPVPAKRWVVYFGGNGEVFEAASQLPLELAAGLNANVVMYNPRGVGGSTGVITGARDLVVDATAVVKYVTTRYGVQEEDLMLFGHSLGGGIAAELASTILPHSPLVLDRTFSSLVDAAKVLSPLKHSGLIEALLPRLFGDFTSVANWKRVRHPRKLIVFHRRDQLIRFGSCSIARLTDEVGTSASAELTGMTSDPHNSPYSMFGNTDNEIMPRIISLFPR